MRPPRCHREGRLRLLGPAFRPARGPRGPSTYSSSANADYPRKLVAIELAETLFSYAVGRIVVWVPRIRAATAGPRPRPRPRSARDRSGRGPRGAEDRHREPETCTLWPGGRRAALKSLGVYEQAHDRLVLGENVAQTAHFVATGGGVGLLSPRSSSRPHSRTRAAPRRESRWTLIPRWNRLGSSSTGPGTGPGSLVPCLRDRQRGRAVTDTARLALGDPLENGYSTETLERSRK